MIKNRIAITVAIAAAAFLLCANPGGIGHEGEARVVGQLMLPSGAPAADTRVGLYPENFDPVKDADTPAYVSTDSLGKFAFSAVAQGDFTILAINRERGIRILISGIHAADSLVKLPVSAMKRTGVMKVFPPPQADVEIGYLYIPGTSLFGFVTRGSDFVVLDSVPEGAIPKIIYSTTNSTAAVTIGSNVTVTSSDTAVVGAPQWKFTRTLVFNTTATGADVAGDVLNFPMLVRLNSGNFTFSQAQANGEDIRFTKENGSPLSYEIEQWDAAAGQATLWVKVDTVYGNDSIHSITMKWGNPDAPAASNGAAVFDTAQNFAAVWHLNQNCGDATGSGHEGVACSALDTAGLIGFCKKFSYSDSIKIAGLLGTPQSLTLSAWTQLDSTQLSGSEVISIGDAAFIRMDYPANNFGVGAAVHLSDNDSVFAHVGSGKYLKQTGWHFITMTHSDASSATTLYIDGAIAGVRIDPSKPINYNGLGQNTYIGKHGNGKTGYPFFGRIDEVRVYQTAITADYVKLCFMNQKNDDRLVSFK